MKKVLLAGIIGAAVFCAPAFAADMPVKASPMAPAFSWTGCYLGGNAGYGWAEQKFNIPTTGVLLNKFTADGGAVGGQVGCDYQSGAWVVGIQGLWDWANLSGRRNERTVPFFDTAKLRDFGTLTGRLGYTIQPTTLLYVKGGAAWAKTKYFDDLIAGGAPSTASVSRSGWTAGVGLEHMIAPNWSVFVEYDYANFGKHTTTFTPPVFTTNISEKLQTVLVGVNYRFGSGAAKY